jgi:hypothetical protein
MRALPLVALLSRDGLALARSHHSAAVYYLLGEELELGDVVAIVGNPARDGSNTIH